MRVDDRADAVFELRDDFAAAVVRGRVGGEEDQHVDIEPDGIAADLHVALFQNVEQADLHQFVEFRQFVDGKNAAVHARDEAEVQGFFGAHAGAAGEFGRIDFADDVGEFGARGEAFGVAIFAPPPGDGDFFFGVLGDEAAADGGDGMQRIVVQRRLGNIDVRNFFIEEAHQQAHQAAFGLTLLAEEQHVVLGQQRDVDFRDDRAVETDDAGEQFFPVGEHAEKVIVDFLLDGFGNPAAFAKFAQRAGFGGGGELHWDLSSMTGWIETPAERKRRRTSRL